MDEVRTKHEDDFDFSRSPLSLYNICQSLSLELCCSSRLFLAWFLFACLRSYQETHFCFSIFSNCHSLLHNGSNWLAWLIRYQRWSSLFCVNADWIIHTRLSERGRERGHFRNQLARPLTMNNWSELIKICRDYPSPPQQIKRHTCICCLFTHSTPFSSSSHWNMFQLAACCHSEQWNVRHFGTASCWNLYGITASNKFQ